MIQFLVGMVIGGALTLFGLAVWAVFEEEREGEKKDEKNH